MGSIVEDAAVHILNISDNFTGKAPDCGSYDVGQEVPYYGPSPLIYGIDNSIVKKVF